MAAYAKIEGMREFRAALKRAETAAPRQLTAAVKSVGKELSTEAAGYAPHRTGELAGGYKATARGGTRVVVGAVVNKVPYAAGAEYGTHSKWKGFTKYGPRGERFAGKAIHHDAAGLTMRIYEALRSVVTAYGWFQG